jgi:ferredoxin
MRIRVDREKCRGHNRCYALAPQLFDVDDLGYSTAKNQGRVPPDEEKPARLAVDNCPEYAIEVVED